MGKKDKKKQKPISAQSAAPASTGGSVSQPSAPTAAPLDPKYYTWGWYGKILLACAVFSTILFFVFVGIMKSVSRHYTDEGIAMYRRAVSLRAMTNEDVDTIAGELSALDAIADIEKLKLVLLRDVAYTKTPITEATKTWLKHQDDEYGLLQAHLREISPDGEKQAELRDEAIEKLEEIREAIRKVLQNIDMKDQYKLSKLVVQQARKIGTYSWYSQLAAGFFSWPAALDAAERAFFEALRYWQQNQEAAYWWGTCLNDVAIPDVAAEKKIMAIKFDPTSSLSDQILGEFKTAYDSAPASPRAIYNYAFALYRKGRVDEALPLYKKVHEGDPQMNTFEGFLAKRRIDIIERKIDMRWYKTDDF